MAFDCCANVKLLVCILTALFGMGSWIAVNGIWVELPILVDQLPEGWNLPSYMAVIIQLANIGPITITLCNVCLKKQPSEKMVIYIMVAIGILASIFLAYFWKETSYMAGAERSTVLFILMFFLALVDCTSSVTFLPFMNIFQPQYLTSFYIGEGFSGLLPSVVALVQGVGQVDCVNTSVTNVTTNVTEYSILGIYKAPSFPVKDFFIFIFAMMIVCGLAFTLLIYMPYCKKEHVDSTDDNDNKTKSLSSLNDYELTDGNGISSTQHFVDIPSNQHQNKAYQLTPVDDGAPTSMSKLTYLYLLLIIAWVNAITNGILPSIQTFACLPYGSMAYHLAVTLSNIANPVACFVAFFLPASTGTVLGGITLVGSGFAVYIMVLAVLSPVPPFVDSAAGAALVVAAFVIVYFLLSFTKVAVATLFRVEGRKALLWCGAVTQLGSAIGAAVMFVTVNIYNLFVQKYPCT